MTNFRPMKKLIFILKQLFCKHKFKFTGNYVNFTGLLCGAKQEFKCEKCSKIEYLEKYENEKMIFYNKPWYLK